MFDFSYLARLPLDRQPDFDALADALAGLQEQLRGLDLNRLGDSDLAALVEALRQAAEALERAGCYSVVWDEQMLVPAERVVQALLQTARECRPDLIRVALGRTCQGLPPWPRVLLAAANFTRDLLAAIRPESARQGSLEPGRFRWGNPPREVCNLILAQWRLLAVLCDGERLRSPVPRAAVLAAVYSDLTMLPDHPAEALRQLRNRLNRRLRSARLDLCVRASRLALWLEPIPSPGRK